LIIILVGNAFHCCEWACNCGIQRTAMAFTQASEIVV